MTSRSIYLLDVRPQCTVLYAVVETKSTSHMIFFSTSNLSQHDQWSCLAPRHALFQSSQVVHCDCTAFIKTWCEAVHLQPYAGKLFTTQLVHPPGCTCHVCSRILWKKGQTVLQGHCCPLKSLTGVNWPNWPALMCLLVVCLPSLSASGQQETKHAQ